jgi:hypothetical protein
MRQTRFLHLALALLVLTGETTHATEPATDDGSQTHAPDPAHVKALAMWHTLSAEDREAVTSVLESTSNLVFIRQDILECLAQGRRADAAKLVADYAHVTTERAAILVDLIGYANGME